MLNFQLATDKDRREAALIERRRALEAERRKRIFNPRERLLGMDYDALNKQIAEKKQLESEKKQLEESYTAQVRKNAEIASIMEAKEKEERRKVEQEINEFRKNFQKPEDRREFDLNDPMLIKKQMPARLKDDDPRCGISSAQKFEGEDLCSVERANIQRTQLKSSLEQQMLEKEAAEKERKRAEDEYKAAVLARDSRAVELDNLDKECRKKLQLSCCQYNKALAEEKNIAKKRNAQKESEDNKAEMYNILTSDMMTENPQVSRSNLGANRQIGFMYKGMTQEQRKEIIMEQQKQIMEAEMRRENEKRLGKEWEEYTNGIQQSIAIMDRENARKKREMEKKLAEENLRMSIEQKNKQEFLKKVVYSNKPTASYFDQFNSTTR